MSDDDGVRTGVSLSIFGVMFAIEFGTFILATFARCFGFWKPIRESLSRKEEVMKAKGFKNLHQYQEFLFNLMDKPYVGVGYWYPDGTCGLPPGGYEDFWRLVANKHSFISIFCCDDNNLFKPIERGVNYLFVSCLSFILFSIGLLFANPDTFNDDLSTDDEQAVQDANTVSLIWNILVVNVVSIFLSELSYYLLSFPCCHKYGNRSEIREVITCFESFISVVFVAVAFLFLLAASFIADAGLKSSFDKSAKSIFWQFVIQAMVLQWFQEFLSFIPAFINTHQKTCVSWIFRNLRIVTCNKIRIGTWYLEKKRQEGGQGADGDTENPAHHHVHEKK